MPNILARFWAKVLITGPDDCWEWQGWHTKDGYGGFRLGHRQTTAHRALYETTKGIIPAGYTIDHLCRNRGCVNPNHLEAVPHYENLRRGIRPPLKTSCRQGHLYDQTNTRVTVKGNRICRTCNSYSYRKSQGRLVDFTGEGSGTWFGMQQMAKTHCPQGHPYDEQNTLRPSNGRNARYCRACLNKSNLCRYYERRRRGTPSRI